MKVIFKHVHFVLTLGPELDTQRNKVSATLNSVVISVRINCLKDLRFVGMFRELESKQYLYIYFASPLNRIEMCQRFFQASNHFSILYEFQLPQRILFYVNYELETGFSKQQFHFRGSKVTCCQTW